MGMRCIDYEHPRLMKQLNRIISVLVTIIGFEVQKRWTYSYLGGGR